MQYWADIGAPQHAVGQQFAEGGTRQAMFIFPDGSGVNIDQPAAVDNIVQLLAGNVRMLTRLLHIPQPGKEGANANQAQHKEWPRPAKF